jgi:hypothetical protein
MSQAIKAILDADATVTTGLANGASSIMHLQEVQGEEAPYIIIRSELVDPNDTQTGQVIDEWEVSLFIVSNYLYTEGAVVGVKEKGEHCRASLHDTKGTYAGDNVAGIEYMYQSPPQIFRKNTQQKIQIEQTYRMWVNR